MSARFIWAQGANGAPHALHDDDETRTLCGRVLPATARRVAPSIGACRSCARSVERRGAESRALVAAALAQVGLREPEHAPQVTDGAAENVRAQGARPSACMAPLVADSPAARLALVREHALRRKDENVRALARITRDDASTPVDVNGAPVRAWRLVESTEWRSTAPARVMSAVCDDDACAHESCDASRAYTAWRDDDDAPQASRATTRDVPALQPTISAMADHASRASVLSGVHVVAPFGRGDYVAPMLGDDVPADHVDAPDADAWAYVAQRMRGDAYGARVLSAVQRQDHERRPWVDYSRTHDVESVARMLAAQDLALILRREDVTRVRVEDWGNVDVDGRPVDDYGVIYPLAGAVRFDVPRARRCGECDGCADAGARVHRFNLRGCAAPVPAIDTVTPGRVISRAIRRAAADATLATSAVAATRAAQRVALRLAGEALTAGHAPAADASSPILDRAPDDVVSLIRTLSAVALISGDAPISERGAMAAPVADALCLLTGHVTTPWGRREALADIRAMWAPARRGDVDTDACECTWDTMGRAARYCRGHGGRGAWQALPVAMLADARDVPMTSGRATPWQESRAIAGRYVGTPAAVDVDTAPRMLAGRMVARADVDTVTTRRA